MSHLELPLVFFTVLAQAAIGAVLISGLRQYACEGPAGDVRREWMFASGLLGLGLVASLFHLGHPLGAPMAIRHLGTAWLSREVLGTGLFLVLTVAGIATAGERIGKGLVVAAGIVGLLAVFSMGMTYAPPAFPAVNNALPLVFFLLTAIMLGSALAALFSPEEKRGGMRAVLTTALVVGLVLYLVVPCVWLSGGTVMAATGRAWGGSVLYWGHIVVGFAIPLAMLWKARRVTPALVVLLLVGELLGRAAFFADTVHTAANLGGLY